MNVSLKKMVIMTHLYSINIQKSQLAKEDSMERLIGQNNVMSGNMKGFSLEAQDRKPNSSTLYGRTVVHPHFFGLMGYYYFL